MKRGFTILCCIIIFYSCNEPVKQKKEETVYVSDTTRVQDTVVFIKDSTMAQTFADSLPDGAYQGMFPCKDCEGIQNTIIFSSDKNYSREEMPWGSPAKPYRAKGKWERKNNRIVLYANGQPELVFKYGKDTLINVESNGNRIGDSSKYILTKRSLATENKSWDQKRNQGIDFIGMGNEPFWSLEIDNEKMILFKLADWKKPMIVPIEKPFVKNDSTYYSLMNGDVAWSVTILPQYCSDGMSDFLYQQKVIVCYKGVAYKGCGVMLNAKAPAKE